MNSKTLSAAIPAILTLGVGCQSLAAEIAWVELEGALASKPDPFAWFTGDIQPTLLDTVRGIEALAWDNDIDGVFVRLKDAALSTTDVEELGRALDAVRNSGKRVHLYAEGYGPNEILLGSYADERILQQGGAVSMPGLYMEEMFLADMLGWLGVRADMVQVGDYKGASEATGRSRPSKEWDENISGLLDGLYGAMQEQITAGYGLSDSDFDDALSEMWLANGDRAIEAGLIDAEVDFPALDAHLAQHYGNEIEWMDDVDLGAGGMNIDTSNPFALFQMLSAEPDNSPRGDTLAVLHVAGTIIDGESSAGGFTGAESTGSRTIRRQIEMLINEDDIRGVVVRIDSPGGSAIASEVIWQGLQLLAEHKPVWISVGSMAASGGYYTAVGGSKIYMNPSSIVGSIGVVGGKYAMGDLYEKLKVNVVGRSRGPRADLFASDRVWNEEQRRLVRDRMVETYDLFTERVTEGRPNIDLSMTAEGRLFEGDRALRLDMVDEIGGLDDALDDLAAELDLDDYDVLHYPGPKSLEDLIEESFGGFLLGAPTDGAAMLQPVRAILGEARFNAAAGQLEAAMLLRDEHVLAVMPMVLLRR
ncbi:MAG: S49 family peptidase [Planctomycetota bacterium]